jgi:hypothetical protein
MLETLQAAVQSYLTPYLAELLVSVLGITIAYLGGKKREARKHLINAEDTVRDLAEQRLNLPSPETEPITSERIRAAIADAVTPDATIDIYLTDKTWFAPLPSELPLLRDIAGSVSWLPYRPARFDRDNYAQTYATVASLVAGVNTVGVFIDLNSDSIYVVIVDADANATFYEPREGRQVPMGEGEYTLSDAVIVF